MPSQVQAAEALRPQVNPSKAALWTGRIISVLVVLFLVFDGVIKVIKDPHVLAAAVEVGYLPSSMVWIGALLLACTLLYAIPRTSVLGAILLTGYLGGAVATNVRISHPIFECIFPVIFGVLTWGSLFLRDPMLREMIPFRKDRQL